jgi:sterol desaturase/sphingolipid hydroxylase (fatty acid hydroxylase superfamily)
MTYNWQAMLTLIGSLAVITLAGKFLIRRIRAFDGMREVNREQDKLKQAKEKYPPVVRATRKIGGITNLVFFTAVVPFIVTLESVPAWKVLVDLVAILMVYDFFYYLTHRFVFHGKGYFRQVHALHHQARNPTHIDAFYVHPLETFIGISLFMGSAALLGFFIGPFHIASLAVAILTFSHLNVINHCHIRMDRFPGKLLSWISVKHANHHKDMHQGNYSTITLLYDKLFRTLV